MTLYHVVDTDFQAFMTGLAVVCILTRRWVASWRRRFGRNVLPLRWQWRSS